MSSRVKLELAVLRAKRGRITQSELSRLTGITQKQLSALERGETSKIDFVTLEKLCTFFQCTPNDLITLEKPSESEELAEADRLIELGLSRAIEARKKSPEDIWARFDAVRAKLAGSVNPTNPSS